MTIINDVGQIILSSLVWLPTQESKPLTIIQSLRFIKKKVDVFYKEISFHSVFATYHCNI